MWRSLSGLVARRRVRSYSSFVNLDTRLRSALSRNGIIVPTPIQSKVIDLLASDSSTDLVFSSETGSGKTLAYLLPVLQRLSTLPAHEHHAHALVLVPTPELATQVHGVAHEYGDDITHVSRLTRGEVLSLGADTGMLVATPGALRTYDVHTVFAQTRAVVLDEADLLLSPSFRADMKDVLSALRSRAQFILSAATIPGVGRKSMQQQLRNMFPGAHVVATDGVHCAVAGLERRMRHVADDADKTAALVEILGERGDDGTVLIFASSGRRADAVTRALADNGVSCAVLHAGLAVDDRARTLARLRSGDMRVLVCTDLAARGLDLRNVTMVIEYDFALNVADHMHRAGRTARAGARGTLVSFVGARDRDLAAGIAATNGAKVDALFSRNRVFRRRIKRAHARS